ncbi:c-type cytochrome [Bradyrhizobium sp. HKCCYLS1011]|uniref:c-type cytochrome n=1 Tax=Bradyrhizobium sp. HKCCYLS1011 TaxID=3420733 RepID=UPI003EBE4AAB
MSAETPVARGSYLVNTIMACGNCHSPRDNAGAVIADRALSGGLTITTPSFTATAPNITSDRDTGIGDWTDAEIKRALSEGVRPDHGPLPGVPLAAVMPVGFYKALLPADLDAIVAYLRTVKPVRNLVPQPTYAAAVHREPYPEAEAGFADADFTRPARRGAYLVTIGHCMECHSTWSDGRSDYRNGLGRGGRPFGPALVQGLGANWHGAIAPNITSDSTSGLGGWSDAEIANAIRHGIARDGHHLALPMAFAFYAGLRDQDVADIIAYLRTLR